MTLTAINVNTINDHIVFSMEGGRSFLMHHGPGSPSTIQEIIGVLNNLIGSPLLVSEELSDDLLNRTIHNFNTVFSAVTVRWSGLADGIDFEETTP